MDRLLHEASHLTGERCQQGRCYSDHRITAPDVRAAARKLKSGKADSDPNLSSDHFIRACDELHVHLALILNAMFSSFSAPDSMLASVLVPIPKNRKKSLCDSSNYRSIAISSIVGKVLDSVVMSKHRAALQTSDLQYGFKPSHSTVQCTFVLNEVVDYYTSRQTPVFVTLLDASKAFDRVQYVKLFKLLLQRNMCPAMVKFLALSYIRQSLSVRWQNTTSTPFPCKNGIKQGAVLSPILFCAYMDALLERLSRLGVGCHIGHVFAGALSYADDLTLLAPTRLAMNAMLRECEAFARDYDVLFNSAKSQTVVFRAGYLRPSAMIEPFTLNDQPIGVVKHALHLGTYIGHRAGSLNIRKARSDITVSSIKLTGLFKHCSLDVKRTLFKAYCTSFYGSPLWNFGCNDVKELQSCFNKCIRIFFGLHPRTRSKYIPLLMNQLPLSLQLFCRFSVFLHNCLISTNKVTQLCANLSLNSSSTVNFNISLLKDKYNVNNEFLIESSLKSLIRSDYYSQIDYDAIVSAHAISDLMHIRDGTFEIIPNLDSMSIVDMLTVICIA